MKKAISILLVLVMCMSMCACSSNTPEAELKDIVLGEWTSTYVLTFDRIGYEIGSVWKRDIALYKGGTGDGQDYLKGSKPDATWSISWEIVDDVINISWGTGLPKGFTYDKATDTLRSVDGTIVYTRVK